MPYFKTTIEGTIIDKKVTKKGKPYICVYDGNVMHNVFTEKKEYDKGEEVILECQVFTERAYIKEDN